jgi:hypothetical protein
MLAFEVVENWELVQVVLMVRQLAVWTADLSVSLSAEKLIDAMVRESANQSVVLSADMMGMTSVVK